MPKVVDHESQRGDFLDAAFALFARQGFQKVTMRGLARKLGVSTGSLYHYFPSKDAIFGQLFDRVSRRDVDLVTADIDAETSIPGKLQALFSFLAEHEGRLADTLLLGLEHRRHAPEDREVLEGTLRTYRAALTEHLGLSDEAFSGPLMSLLLGAIVHRVLDPEGVDPAVHLAVLGRVLEQLVPQPPSD